METPEARVARYRDQMAELEARVAALTDDLFEARQAVLTQGQQVIALAAALEAIQTAWAQSYDCSRDPGHRIMHAALDAAGGLASARGN